MRISVLLFVRWTVAVFVMLVGLFAVVAQFVVGATLLWKAAPFAREFGVDILMGLLSGSAVFALLAYIFFTLGVRLFLQAGALHKAILEICKERAINQPLA